MRKFSLCSFKHEDELKRQANEVRRSAGIAQEKRFDTMSLLYGTIVPALRKDGWDFQLMPWKSIEEADEVPAYVEYTTDQRKQLTLHVRDDVYEQFYQNEPYARLILAHEMSHMLLHMDATHFFTVNSDIQRSSYSNNQSVEWQANYMASCLLVSDEIIYQYSDIDALAFDCNLYIDDILRERFDGLNRRRRRANRLANVGDCCNKCGGFIIKEQSKYVCHNCRDEA